MSFSSVCPSSSASSRSRLRSVPGSTPEGHLEPIAVKMLSLKPEDLILKQNEQISQLESDIRWLSKRYEIAKNFIKRHSATIEALKAENTELKRRLADSVAEITALKAPSLQPRPPAEAPPDIRSRFRRTLALSS